MFRVYKAPKFQKKIDKILEKSELEELDLFIEELKSGNIHGKSLTYDFFREKKIGGKRIYFLVYPEVKTVLLVSCSKKKYQQETIDEIKYLLPKFKELAYKMNKN